MKIAVLCSSRMAMPALQKLMGQGKVAAVGLPEGKDEIIQVCTHFAKQHNVPVQVFTRKGFGEQLRAWLQQYAPDVVFVMTFPFRIPASALGVPQHGFVNFHYGLLPQMRGADAIFESIRLQKNTAGVTAHIMDAGFDTGPIILREEIPLPPHFTYGMLSAQLAYKGTEMSDKIVDMLAGNGKLESTPQNESEAHYYPKLPPTGTQLQWQSMDSAQLLALINACNPSSKNGVPTSVNGWTIGICCATPVTLSGEVAAYTPGQVLVADPQNGMLVLTTDGLALKLEVVYTEEGFFPGYALTAFGIVPGMKFTDTMNM